MKMRAELEKLKLEALQFLSWWKDELSACIPDDLRRRLEQRSRRITIRPARDHVEVDVVTGTEGLTLREEVPLDGLDDAGWTQIETLMEDSVSRIRLTGRSIFTTSVSLPAAAVRNLRQALELQLPLISPLVPSAVCWGYRTGARTADRMEVRVVLARKADVDQLVDLFDRRGLVAPPVETVVDEGTVVLRPGRRRLWSPERRERRMAFAVGLLLLATIPVTIWAGSGFAVWMGNRNLEMLRTQVAPINAATRRAGIADGRRRAIAPLARQAAVAPVLDDLAVSLPETVYLESFRFSGRDDIGFLVAGQVDDETAKAIQEASQLLQIMDAQGEGNEGTPVELRARVR
jgi:hypothetical protein